MHATIFAVDSAFANTSSLGQRHNVFIRDADSGGVTFFVKDARGAEEIAAVINKWCNPDDSLAGTCEKLLAEEQRRKAEPVAIDERFMERVE